MRKDYRFIFLGASCFALACATQRPDECLILEKDEGLGAEFCDALLSGPVNPPAGCKFCTRCYMATDKCRRVSPPLVEIAPNHFCACHHLDKVQ